MPRSIASVLVIWRRAVVLGTLMMASVVSCTLVFAHFHLYQSQFDYYPGQFDQRRLLALVPLVFEAAYEGDQVAQDLLVRIGIEVGTTANAIIKRLGLETTDVEVVLGGSVFKGKGPLLVDTVTQVVHRIAPQATVVLPEFEPVVGAVFLALESLGVQVNETVYANVRASLPDELRPEQPS
jgi:N-acetylglucosamine kinase-like BadF-type ATPase